MVLFSHWLFRLKNWRFSANSCKGFIVSLKWAQKQIIPHSNRENDDFIALLLVKLLSFNLVCKEKDNGKQIFELTLI